MILWLLNECKIGLGSQGKSTKTPFMWAVQEGQLEMAKLLRQQGVDINAKDIYGNNALHSACYAGSENTITWLLDSCRVSIETKGGAKKTIPWK